MFRDRCVAKMYEFYFARKVWSRFPFTLDLEAKATVYLCMISLNICVYAWFISMRDMSLAL